MKIQESGENYLETILMLEQKNGTVRSIDIANELAFSKPSVSRAMSILRSAGYITMDKNNLILLTDRLDSVSLPSAFQSYTSLLTTLIGKPSL